MPIQEILEYAYMALFMGVMVVPPLLIANWYHAEVEKSAGGRRLARDNAKYAARRTAASIHNVSQQVRGVQGAVEIGSGLWNGDYGEQATSTWVRAIKYLGLWMLGVGVVLLPAILLIK